MTDYERIRREMMQHPVKTERDRVIRGLITQAEYAKTMGNDGLSGLFESAWRMLVDAGEPT